MMGTPAYGTLLATSLVAPVMSIPGDSTAGLIAAACWTVLYFGLAATLFGATLATFDRCLERNVKPPRQVVSGSGRSAVLGEN
jgi:hypothetical protein